MFYILAGLILLLFAYFIFLDYVAWEGPIPRHNGPAIERFAQSYEDAKQSLGEVFLPLFTALIEFIVDEDVSNG